MSLMKNHLSGFTEQPPLSDDSYEDNQFETDLDDIEYDTDDEWDEDHALDQVMNDMVKDLSSEDISKIVKESEEVIEEPIQPTPNKVSNRYEQRSNYLTKSTDWDSKEKEGLLPDTVETAELDLQTGQISTPEPPIKKG